MKSYRSYLFDADGTLIDTTELIFRCYEHSLPRFGRKDVTREMIVANIGLTLRRQMESYLGTMDDERYEEVRAVHMKYQKRIYPRYLKAFPGVREGLAALKAQNKICGVVSSRMRDTLVLYLEVTGLLDGMDVIVTPEDTTRHKPDAEPLTEAVRRCGVRREHAVYIGDAPWDIECGAAAGVDTALVTWTCNAPDAFLTAPTWRIQSMEELIRSAERSEDDV